MHQGYDITTTQKLNLFMTTSQVSRKYNSKIHTKTFTNFGIYILYTLIKKSVQIYSMLGQGKCQGCGNKGHNEIACDIFVKKLIRYTEKKNYGLEKYYINNK